MGVTVSLFSVDLHAVFEAWRKTPLDKLLVRLPRGRMASLLAGPLDGVIVDGGRPAPQGLAGVTPESRRAAFDALVEDLAAAALHDAPALALREVLAAIAKVSGRAELAPMALETDAVPAYPPELLQEPAIEDASSGTGLVTWISDPEISAAALGAVRKAIELPAGAFPAGEPALFRDLAEGLANLLDDTVRPGQSLVALRT